MYHPGINWFRSACISVLVSAGCSTASAETPESFYGRQTVSIVSPFGEAGLYGVITRMLVRHLPKHLPGAARAVSQFMPGGGGLLQANYLFNLAAKDGAVIGILYDNIPSAQVLQPEQAKYDVRKFGALGSINRGEIGILMLMARTGVSSLSDAKAKDVALGATGTGSAQYVVPIVMNRLMGTKFKLVPGYKSTGELFLAIEKGELGGVFTNVNTLFQARPDWFKKGSFNTIAQLAESRHRDFPNAPLMEELLENSQDKAVFAFLSKSRTPGKILVVPPGVPADRLAALRNAFVQCMSDKEFLEEAKKAALEVEPRTGEGAAQLMADTVNTPPSVIARVQALSQVK